MNLMQLDHTDRRVHSRRTHRDIPGRSSREIGHAGIYTMHIVYIRTHIYIRTRTHTYTHTPTPADREFVCEFSGTSMHPGAPHRTRLSNKRRSSPQRHLVDYRNQSYHDTISEYSGVITASARIIAA